MKTHAYTHSLETNHHMFMKLDNGRVYCLPDGYEVIDRSLDIIRFVLNPTFTNNEVSLLIPQPVPVCSLTSSPAWKPKLYAD